LTTAVQPPQSALAPRGRALGDRLFRYLGLACGLVVLATLALILASTVQKAWPVFQQVGFKFVTTQRWAPDTAQVFGTLSFVFGTVVISAIALVLSVPVSIGIALFLSDIAPGRLKRPVGTLIDLLAAIPSVVFGLWGILVLAPWIIKAYQAFSHATRSIPVVSALFAGPVSGKSFFTAGLILAVMITPIITSLTREVFDTVPQSHKEAAYSVGATRWEMVRAAIFPYSRAGMVGAVGLGLGRAMGETIAVALVIGSQPQITAHLLQPGDAMPAVIVNQFGEAGGLHRAALIGLGVELFVLTVIVNIVARLIVARGQKIR
jgi:phosphate transport system permease protein